MEETTATQAIETEQPIMLVSIDPDSFLIHFTRALAFRSSKQGTNLENILVDTDGTVVGVDGNILYAGTLRTQTRPEDPVFPKRLVLSAVQIEPLLKMIKADPFRGTGSVIVNLETNTWAFKEGSFYLKPLEVRFPNYKGAFGSEVPFNGRVWYSPKLLGIICKQAGKDPFEMVIGGKDDKGHWSPTYINYTGEHGGKCIIMPIIED